jgi:ABC-type Zn2+ transport system substrate-binding protein/surface adhesin
MQRKSDNRHMQIMQGMMFMTEYTKLAGFNQETEFNMARTFHTLGLSHLAVPHYENVLRLPSKKMEGIEEPKPLEEVYHLPEVDEDDIDDYDDDEDEEEEEDYTDLKREAAYNLHLIYVNSGAMTLAQIVLLKYCTI